MWSVIVYAEESALGAGFALAVYRSLVDVVERVEVLFTPGPVADHCRPGKHADTRNVGLAELTALAVDPRVSSGDAFVLDAPAQIAPVWGVDDRVAWPEGEPFLLVGPPGVGKTTLVGQLVRARVGLQSSVLGLPVRPGERVLYFACDRPRQIARSLRRTFADEDREALQERLVVLSGPPTQDVGQRPEYLLQEVQRFEADTLVIDSLKDIAVGLATDETGAAVNRALQLVVAAGCEVVSLHHQRKRQRGGKPKTLSDVYGSVWLTAGAGSVLLLWGDAGDPVVELSHLKPPATEIGPLQVEHDHDTGTSIAYASFNVVAFLEQNPGLTAMELARAMFSTARPSDAQRKKAERILKRHRVEPEMPVRPALTSVP